MATLCSWLMFVMTGQRVPEKAFIPVVQDDQGPTLDEQLAAVEKRISRRFQDGSRNNRSPGDRQDGQGR